MKLTAEEVIRDVFGDAVFTVGDVRRRTTLPHPKAVVSRLKTEGVLERVGRGRYHLAPPDRRRSIHAHEYALALRRVGRVPGAVVTLPTCLEVLTRGRYVVGRSATAWPIHVAATPVDAPRVRQALVEEGLAVIDASQRMNRPGIVVVLEEEATLPFEVVDGVRVLARREVRRRLADGHPDESALELIA